MTTLRFHLYHGDDLLDLRAELHDDALEEHGGGAAHVEGADGWRLPPCAELAAYDATEEILRVAAALAHRPWSDSYVRAVPSWTTAPHAEPWSDEDALTDACLAWSNAQQAAYDEDHPTGRSDAQIYREEAPYGSER